MTPCNWTNRCRYDAQWTVTAPRLTRASGSSRLAPKLHEHPPVCGNHLAMVLARVTTPGQTATVVRREE